MRIEAVTFRCDAAYRPRLQGAIHTCRPSGQWEALADLGDGVLQPDNTVRVTIPAACAPTRWVIVRVDDAGEYAWPFSCTVQEIEITGIRVGDGPGIA